MSFLPMLSMKGKDNCEMKRISLLPRRSRFPFEEVFSRYCAEELHFRKEKSSMTKPKNSSEIPSSIVQLPEGIQV